MSAQHTAAPWHVNGYYFERDASAPTGRRCKICSPDSDLAEGFTINAANVQVCEIERHSRLSDARLIAAAPDMLETLEYLESVLSEQSEETFERELIRIRYAIAKAEGRDHA